MKPFFEGLLGIAVAVALHALLGKVSASLVIVLNSFAWVVLFFGLVRNEVFGALMGTICGLLQDSFSLGVFGVGGLTKTLLGFAAGYISRRINVIPVRRTILFVLIIATLELLLWKSLAFFLFGERFWTAGGLAFLQPLATAVVVTGAFQVERRREARRA